MRLVQSVCIAAALVASSTVAMADPRPFTFVTDTYAEGRGNWEYEQWITYDAHKDSDPGFDRFRLRHEFEFGLADNFDLAIYFLEWSYTDSAEFNGTRWDGFAVEGIVYLSNPVTDLVGSGLYAEVGVGEDSLELELKGLLHKDWGNWTAAYNLILETEIEGVFDSAAGNEVEGVIGHALGVSYKLGGGWQVGGELVVESVYSDWSDYEGTSVYAGPNVAYTAGKNLWFALTPQVQLTSEDDEPDFRVRAIIGWQF
jgi:hypothetical protein